MDIELDFDTATKAALGAHGLPRAITWPAGAFAPRSGDRMVFTMSQGIMGAAAFEVCGIEHFIGPSPASLSKLDELAAHAKAVTVRHRVRLRLAAAAAAGAG
jgi:hypothetical protein